MKTLKTKAGIGSLLHAGVVGMSLGLGPWACKEKPSVQAPPKEETQVAKHASLYQCPMHPQILRHEPGTCPICGMDLVPISEERAMEAGQPAASPDSLQAGSLVQITPERIRAVGVRTLKVTQKAMPAARTLEGIVSLDPARVSTLTARVAGFLEEVTSKVPGDRVAAGEVLARLYSPEVAASLREWQNARRLRDSQGAIGQPTAFAESLEVSARRRLVNLGMPGEELERLRSAEATPNDLVLRAPSVGLVLERLVEKGQAVSMGAALVRIVDLGEVLVVGQLPPSEMAHVTLGGRVRVEPQGRSSQSFEGRVDGLAPGLNAETRAAELRVRVRQAKDYPLRPEMPVTLHFEEQQGAAPLVVVIPEQAVIRTGPRNLVIVQEGEGSFRPREVKLGRSQNGEVEVVSGLSEGEWLVTSSQFLIDSESNLRAAVAALRGRD